MNGAQIVDRVVDILEAFLRVGPELGVSELSRALGLKKATTHRLLASLKRRSIISQDPLTRRYRLGMRLWQLGTAAGMRMRWIERAQPALRTLSDAVGETSHLAVLDDGMVLYVGKAESSRSLRMPSQVGRRVPAHCTALGKVLLAHLPADEVTRIIATHGLASVTRATITDADELKQHFVSIRTKGYAVDDGEIEDGLRCVAAPVRGSHGEVIAAISVAGPSPRLPREALPRYADLLRSAADTISAEFAYTTDVTPPLEVDLTEIPEVHAAKA